MKMTSDEKCDYFTRETLIDVSICVKQSTLRSLSNEQTLSQYNQTFPFNNKHINCSFHDHRSIPFASETRSRKQWVFDSIY